MVGTRKCGFAWKLSVFGGPSDIQHAYDVRNGFHYQMDQAFQIAESPFRCIV